MNLFRSTKIIEKPRMWCLGLWNQDVINELDLMRVTFRSQVVQLYKYETAPNFIQLSQKLTSDCLLISVYLLVRVFTFSYQFLQDVIIRLFRFRIRIQMLYSTFPKMDRVL